MIIETDTVLLKSCYEKYKNRFGYITFENHLKVYTDFLAQTGFKEIENGYSKEQFELNKKGMVNILELIKGLCDLHKVHGIPCKVSLENLGHKLNEKE